MNNSSLEMNNKNISTNNQAKTPIFALEILTKIKENFPKPISDYWGEGVILNTVEWFKMAQGKALNSGAKYVSVYFNIDEDSEIDTCLKLFSEIQSLSKVPLIIRGSGQKTLDEKLIPALVQQISKPAIVAFAQDSNYTAIVNSILNSNYRDEIRLVLRAPIDINLTKELNVLCMDLGMKPQNIIMDTDTGCVGMGLDYGYSIIERLCIARALLKKPRILILDDSTSAVDTATEAKIRESFGTTLKGATKIIIAQRISSVIDADQILVLDEGKIVGLGSHEQLLKDCGPYQEIYYSQMDREVSA